MDNLEVTVVLVNWNGKHYLEKFLPALFASNYPNFQIILVDNASKDESVSYVRAHYPTIQIIENDKNYGFAEGNNRALAYVRTAYMVLLNTDVEVSPDWLKYLVACAQDKPDVAAIQPKILAYNHKTHFEYAGAAGGYIDHWGYPFCRGRIFDDVEIDNRQYNAASALFWASGACMFLRTEVVQKIGLFDPIFFAHWEEIDFCWRAQNAGYRIYYEPLSVVYHVGGGTLPKANSYKVYLNFRNSLLTLLKNLPLGSALLHLFIRMCLDFVAAAKGALSGNLLYGWAIFRAHLGFYRRLPHYLSQKTIRPKPFHAHKGVYKRSIVWAYFVKKQKQFSKLQDTEELTRN